MIEVRQHVTRATHTWIRRQGMADVPPPRLTKLPVPVHRDAQPVLDPRLLLPAQPVELCPIDGISHIVILPVVRVHDPPAALLQRVVGDTHGVQHHAAEIQVGDLIAGSHVIDLPDLALMQDRVKGVCGVAGVKISSRGTAVAMKDHGLLAVQQAGKFGNNLCESSLVKWLLELTRKPGRLAVLSGY